MKHHNFWIIGETKWNNGFARIAIASTKTEARKTAEQWIALAEDRWEKGKQHLDYILKKHNPKHMTFDNYVNKYRYRGSSESVIIRAYFMTIEGVWLTGPQGERIHIKEARVTAKKEVAKQLNQRSNFVDQMVKSIST